MAINFRQTYYLKPASIYYMVFKLFVRTNLKFESHKVKRVRNRSDNIPYGSGIDIR